MNTEHELIAAVVEIYTANRPAGLPEPVAIYPEMRIEEKVRPCVVVSVDGTQWLHPRLFQCELAMETQVRTEDVGNAGTVNAWSDAIFEAMLPLVSKIEDALLLKKMRLRYLYPLPPTDEANGADGFNSTRRWKIRIQTTELMQWSDGDTVLWSDGRPVENSN